MRITTRTELNIGAKIVVRSLVKNNIKQKETA